MQFHTILYSYAQVTAVLLAMRSVVFAGPGKQHDRHYHQHENHGNHRVPPSSSPTRLITCPDQCTHPRTIRAGITKLVANSNCNTGSIALFNQLCDGNQLATKYFGDWFTFTAPKKGCKATATVDLAFFGPYVYVTPHTCPQKLSQCAKQTFPSYLGMPLPERLISHYSESK